VRRRSLPFGYGLGEIQSRRDLAQTLLAYGRFRRGDNSQEGRALIERALRLFEEMNATGGSRRRARRWLPFDHADPHLLFEMLPYKRRYLARRNFVRGIAGANE
jgi:hypothetical protein